LKVGFNPFRVDFLGLIVFVEKNCSWCSSKVHNFLGLKVGFDPFGVDFLGLFMFVEREKKNFFRVERESEG